MYTSPIPRGGKRISRLKRNAPLLLALASTTNAARKAAISKVKRDVIFALVECARNIIAGKVRLTPSQHSSLKRKHGELKLFASPTGNVETKRSLLQSGGFLGFLLKPLVGLLGGLLGGAR